MIAFLIVLKSQLKMSIEHGKIKSNTIHLLTKVSLFYQFNQIFYQILSLAKISVDRAILFGSKLYWHKYSLQIRIILLVILPYIKKDIQRYHPFLKLYWLRYCIGQNKILTEILSLAWIFIVRYGQMKYNGPGDGQVHTCPWLKKLTKKRNLRFLIW